MSKVLSRFINFRCPTSTYQSFGASRACTIGVLDAKRRKVALVGNSHAQMYGKLVDEVLTQQKIGGLLVPLNGCLPTVKINISTKCLEMAKANLAAIINKSEVSIVLISTTWYRANYVDESGLAVTKSDLTAAVIDLIDILERANKQVGLFSPILIPNQPLASDLPRQVKFGQMTQNEAQRYLSLPRRLYEDAFLSINTLMENKLDGSYFKVYEDLCDELKCYFGNEKTMFFSDESHLSEHGIERLTKTRTAIDNYVSGALR